MFLTKLFIYYYGCYFPVTFYLEECSALYGDVVKSFSGFLKSSCGDIFFLCFGSLLLSSGCQGLGTGQMG